MNFMYRLGHFMCHLVSWLEYSVSMFCRIVISSFCGFVMSLCSAEASDDGAKALETLEGLSVELECDRDRVKHKVRQLTKTKMLGFVQLF